MEECIKSNRIKAAIKFLIQQLLRLVSSFEDVARLMLIFQTNHPENNNHRFAGLAVYPKDPNFIVAILEDHTQANEPTGDNPYKVANTLCIINADAREIRIFANGQDPTRDFYGPPAFSPGGAHIAWQQWSHPDMPWDQSKIYIADVSTDSTTLKFDNVRAVPFQSTRPVIPAYPNWSNDKTLIFHL